MARRLGKLESLPDVPAQSRSIVELPEAESIFRAVRPRLFRVAYARVKSVREAEDIVQEAWIRWQTCDRTLVHDAPALLTTMAERLAINAGKSAHARYETHVTQLPDRPDRGAGPELIAVRGDEIRAAIRRILETLSPAERAALLLREAFDYSYEEIAEVIQQTPVASRQHVSRARRHLMSDRHSVVSDGEQRRLLQAFVAATRTGDMSALERLLGGQVAKGERLKTRTLLDTR